MTCAIVLIHSGLHVPWHPACHPTTTILRRDALPSPMPAPTTVPLSRLKPNPANPERCYLCFYVQDRHASC